jgi:hypothetical protein
MLSVKVKELQELLLKLEEVTLEQDKELMSVLEEKIIIMYICKGKEVD